MKKSRVTAADTATWYCSMVLVALVMLKFFSGSWYDDDTISEVREAGCDEIYMVGEGETLNTISDKCGDPYIVEQNPHINDHDDVYPGLVIKITRTNPTLQLT